MNLSKKNFTSKRKLSQIDTNKLPSLFKTNGGPSLRSPLEQILTDSLVNQSLNIQQIQSSIRHRKYESKQNQIIRFRQIAKSNYIKNVTQVATQQLTRSRIESIKLLQKRMQQHDSQQLTIKADIKKQQNEYRCIEKRRIFQRQRKIEELQHFQKLKQRKQQIKDKNIQLQNTVKTFTLYQQFCQSLLYKKLQTQDISQIDPENTFRFIESLEKSCLDECETKKILFQDISFRKNRIEQLKSQLQPMRDKLVSRKVNILKMIERIDDENVEYKNYMNMLQFDRQKRGPFNTIILAAQKFMRQRGRRQLKDENGFIQTLTKMEHQLSKHIEDIQKAKKLDNSLYCKKQYDYFLGRIHPSRAGSNQQKTYKK